MRMTVSSSSSSSMSVTSKASSSTMMMMMTTTTTTTRRHSQLRNQQKQQQLKIQQQLLFQNLDTYQQHPYATEETSLSLLLPQQTEPEQEPQHKRSPPLLASRKVQKLIIYDPIEGDEEENDNTNNDNSNNENMSDEDTSEDNFRPTTIVACSHILGNNDYNNNSTSSSSSTTASQSTLVQFYYKVESTDGSVDDDVNKHNTTTVTTNTQSQTEVTNMNEDIPTYISSTMIETVGAELCNKDNGSSSFQQCTLSVSSGPADVAVDTMNVTGTTGVCQQQSEERCVLYSGSILITHLANKDCTSESIIDATMDVLKNNVADSDVFIDIVNERIKKQQQQQQKEKETQGEMNGGGDGIGIGIGNNTVQVTNVDIVDGPNNTINGAVTEVSSESSSNNEITAAAIVLMALLGLLFCILMILMFLYRRRQRKLRQQENGEKQLNSMSPQSTDPGSVQTDTSPDDDWGAGSKNNRYTKPDYYDLAKKHNAVDVHKCSSATCHLCCPTTASALTSLSSSPTASFGVGAPIPNNTTSSNNNSVIPGKSQKTPSTVRMIPVGRNYKLHYSNKRRFSSAIEDNTDTDADKDAADAAALAKRQAGYVATHPTVDTKNNSNNNDDGNEDDDDDADADSLDRLATMPPPEPLTSPPSTIIMNGSGRRHRSRSNKKRRKKVAKALMLLSNQHQQHQQHDPSDEYNHDDGDDDDDEYGPYAQQQHQQKPDPPSTVFNADNNDDKSLIPFDERNMDKEQRVPNNRNNHDGYNDDGNNNNNNNNTSPTTKSKSHWDWARSASPN